MAVLDYRWRGILLPSTTQAAAGAGSAVTAAALELGRFHRGLIMLEVTSAAAAVGDTLDVWLQKNIQNAAGAKQYTDFIHFTQILGNGGNNQRAIAEIMNDGGPPTSTLHVQQNKVLAAGVNQGPWSDDWQIAWTTVGATAAFTFNVTAALFG